MIVIEAIRTGCWNAITGRRQVVTVDTCAAELRQGVASIAGYVPVSESQLARATVEPLSQVAKAAAAKQFLRDGLTGSSVYTSIDMRLLLARHPLRLDTRHPLVIEEMFALEADQKQEAGATMISLLRDLHCYGRGRSRL